MNTSQQQRYNFLYEQHLINLRLQGKRPSTIDGYSRAVRRIAAFFDKSPDNLCIVVVPIYALFFFIWAVMLLDSKRSEKVTLEKLN